MQRTVIPQNVSNGYLTK